MRTMRAPHPKLVLLFALLAPGAGHFLLGRYKRAFGFAVFSLLFAALTWHFCPPDRSWVGRTAAGLFVWALSLPDAYRSAALRAQLAARRERVASASMVAMTHV